MYCIDASVIVNSQLEREPYHNQSKDFLIIVEEKNLKVFLPEIVIPEITSGILRATMDENFAFQFANNLRSISNFLFVPVDSKLANLASWIICKTGLKSADAIYITLAFDYNLELITLDKEQLEKGKKLVKVRRP